MFCFFIFITTGDVGGSRRSRRRVSSSRVVVGMGCIIIYYYQLYLYIIYHITSPPTDVNANRLQLLLMSLLGPTPKTKHLQTTQTLIILPVRIPRLHNNKQIALQQKTLNNPKTSPHNARKMAMVAQARRPERAAWLHHRDRRLHELVCSIEYCVGDAEGQV